MKERKNNYDLLRIISAIAVITLHICGTYYSFIVNGITENSIVSQKANEAFIICIYRALTIFAVPCFVMLSGAFILADDRNTDYRYFYSKSFAKLGIPTLLFSLFYMIYRLPFCFTGEGRGLWPLLKDMLKGEPMYHMWYLFMLVGVYLLAPIVLRFKNSISEKTFFAVSFVFLIWGCVSGWTGSVGIKWDMGQSFEYLGYFMTGYCIRKYAEYEKLRGGGSNSIVIEKV